MDISQRTRTVSATVSGVVDRYPDQRDVPAERRLQQQQHRDGVAARLRARVRSVALRAEARSASRSVYFGAAGELAYLERQDVLNDPTTNHILWRIDGAPQVRAAVQHAAVPDGDDDRRRGASRDWMESVDPLTGAQVSSNLTRQLFTSHDAR